MIMRWWMKHESSVDRARDHESRVHVGVEFVHPSSSLVAKALAHGVQMLSSAGDVGQRERRAVGSGAGECKRGAHRRI